MRHEKILWEICLLKAVPQNLPQRKYLVILTVSLALIIDSFSSSILMPDFSGVKIIAVVFYYNTALLLAIYLLLRLIGYAERSVQTLTAIAGSGFFISLVLFPALLIMSVNEQLAKTLVFYILIDNVWRIVVNAHIFRHALSVSRLFAMVISLSYLFLGILIAEFLLTK